MSPESSVVDEPLLSSPASPVCAVSMLSEKIAEFSSEMAPLPDPPAEEAKLGIWPAPLELEAARPPNPPAAGPVEAEAIASEKSMATVEEPKSSAVCGVSAAGAAMAAL